MKVPKDTNKKLAHVPIKHRIFCYDGTIVLDFLNRTFMPLSYFVKLEVVYEIGAGTPPSKEHMKDPAKYEDVFMSVSEMYDYYRMFRQSVDYTAPIENRWKFGLLIKKLIYSKNGWQFNVKRVGRAQLWFAGPAVLRVKAPAEDRVSHPVAELNVLAGQVEAGPDDLNDEDHEDMVDSLAYSMHAKPPEQTLVAKTTAEFLDRVVGPMVLDRVLGVDKGKPGGDFTVEVLAEKMSDGTTEMKELKFVEVKGKDFEDMEFEVDVRVQPPTPGQFGEEDPTLT